MDFKDHNLKDLVVSLEAEVAKSLAEVRHAQDDLDKVENRQKFILALLHYIKTKV
jgi:hypothetical protein